MHYPNTVTEVELDNNKELQRRHTVADKSCRSLKILAEVFEHVQLGGLFDLAAWISSLLGDLARLICNLFHKGKVTTQSISSFTLGSLQAVLFRITKSMLSGSRLALHVVQTYASLAVSLSSTISTLIPVLNILSALGNFINDTIKFCRKKAKDAKEILFYSGKTSFTAITIAGVIASLLLGPVAPTGIALLLTGVIGYTACSVTKASIDYAKGCSRSIFQPPREKSRSEQLLPMAEKVA